MARRAAAVGARAAIDALAQGLMRLENWARWVCTGEVSMILRHYYPSSAALGVRFVSTQIWDYEAAAVPIDERDAELVDELIGTLPDAMREAVRYRYIGRAKRSLPESLVGALVREAACRIATVCADRGGCV
jgi:hypothetical protein